MTHTLKKSFNDFFLEIKKEFKDAGKLNEIVRPRSKINWGSGFGVYTIFHQTIDYDGLVYVGLTGKYTRDKNGIVSLTDGNFKKRSVRYTPYRFCESIKDPLDFRFSFRFSPKFTDGKRQGKAKYDRDAYDHTIFYKDLVLLTFDLNKHPKYSPALLESLILTKYHSVASELPPANNQL